jgi:hypothetical protein
MNGTKPQGAALLGRRIGIALFWCLAVYVIAASTRSVVSELYGSPSQGADAIACASTLRELRESLIQHASAELQLARDDARTRRWFGAWDKTFAASASHCGPLADTRRTLLSLRERVEAMLHDYARDKSPLNESIQRALQRYLPRTTSPRET